MKKIFCLLATVTFVQLSFCQWKQDQFVIGTFADPRISTDNNSSKDLSSYTLAKNAYFNLLTGPQYYMGSRDFSMMDRTLKLAEKFNMHLLVIDSRLQIANPAFNADTAMKIISHFKSVNSPAFAGYYLLGEVPQKNIDAVKKWTVFFKQNDPGKLVYYYLLPRYAFSSNSDYSDYVNSFFTNNASAPDVVSFDYYPFQKNNQIRNSYFYNLNVISQKAGSKPFWSYVLSTSSPNLPDPTEYQINFSVFCPIAYGAKGIVYFTYETIPQRNNAQYGDAIIGKTGAPTNKYAIVKRINLYVSKVLGPVIMNSKKIGTYHTSQQSDNETLDKSQVASPQFIQTDNTKLLIGRFKSLDNASNYLVIVNKENTQLNNVNFLLNGNFVNTIAQYPGMYTLNASDPVTPQKINATLTAGKTKFSISKFMPGEAVLIKF